MSDLTTKFSPVDWEIPNIDKQRQADVKKLQTESLKVYYKNVKGQEDHYNLESIKPTTIKDWLERSFAH